MSNCTKRADVKPQLRGFKERMKIKGTASVKKWEDVFNYAVYHAYIDMQLRTIKGHNMEQTKDIRETLSKKFCEYFENSAPDSQESFDKWHQETCEYFLSELNKKLKEKKLCFGKAQKVINMTFKYLYCFDDAEKYEDYFKFCHMPIDSYTLNWCYENGLYNKNDIENWSNLDEKGYYELSKKIAKLLDCPMISEFVIWPEEIAKVRERSFIKLFVEYIASNYDMFVTEDINKFDCVHIQDEELNKIIETQISSINRGRAKDKIDKLNASNLYKIALTLDSSPLLSKIKQSIKLLNRNGF